MRTVKYFGIIQGAKRGLSLGGVLLLVSALLSPAQNLGLGTGSRSPSPSDSSDQYPAVQSQGRNSGTERPVDAPPPRKTQINRRLGLLGRKGGGFDPKAFEMRGRELQGQFYEIGGNPSNPSSSPAATPVGSTLEKQKDESRQWLFWVGAAGVAGVSAGVAGFILMGNAHPTAPPPKYLYLNDKPSP